MMKKVSEYITHNTTYVLFFDSVENAYGAIRSDYINSDGTINATLRRYQLFMADSVERVLGKINHEYEIEDYQKMGFSTIEAVLLAQGFDIETAREAGRKAKEMGY